MSGPVPLALAVLLALGPALAAAPPSYRVAASWAAGEAGTLQLLLDRTVTDAVEKAHWGTGTWEEAEPRPARLRLVASGSVRAVLDLERPLARLSAKDSLPGEPPRVTVDFSTGFGSYSGPITRWVVVEQGQIRWAKARDARGHRVVIAVMDSLKTGWRRVQRKDGSLDVYELACRPRFKDTAAGDVSFLLMYRHFRLEGDDWPLTSSRRRGYWECDQAFPPESAFP